MVIATAETILMLRARNAVLGVGDEESVSVTTKLKTPDCVGVPEIVPEAELRERPPGIDPLLIVQLVGAMPPKEVRLLE